MSEFIWNTVGRFLIVGTMFLLIGTIRKSSPAVTHSNSPSLLSVATTLFLVWAGLYLLPALIGYLLLGNASALFNPKNLGTLRQFIHSGWGIVVIVTLFWVSKRCWNYQFPLKIDTEASLRWMDYTVLLSVALTLPIVKLNLEHLASGPMRSMILPGPLWLDLLGMSLVSPVLEELLFRGLVYSTFRQYLPWKTAMWLAAICFALYHAQAITLRSLCSIAISGALFAYVFEKSGSLIPGIVAHSAQNAVYIVGGYLPIVLQIVPFTLIAVFSLGIIVLFVQFASKEATQTIRGT